jgi:DNA polymerase-3 subunit gamma/tau
MEVTARQWRPQDFDDFVGQEHVIQSLKNSIRSGRIGHAFLFSGPRGVGKTSCARVFGKALNCLDGGPTATPCGKCRNCVEISRGNSVDVLEIDGASNRGIDQIREIRDNLQFMPSGSRYKIYVIDEVHMLTDQAFNALLKTLEEPPPHIVFIFATTEPHKVKITIRSRCQHFRFRRLSIDQIAKQLERILKEYEINSETEALKWIARAADGSMRDSQSLLDQCIIYSGDKITRDKVKEILGTIPEERFLDFMGILVRQDAANMYAFIQQLYEEGEEIGFFVEELIQQFRWIILIKSGVPNFQEMEEGYFESLKKFSNLFSLYQLHRLIELFLNLHKELKITDKERFILENTFFQALDYRSFINIPHLVQKIEKLEKALVDGGDFQIEETLLEQEPPQRKSAEQMTPPKQEQTSSQETEPEKTETQPSGNNGATDRNSDGPEGAEQVWREFKAKVADKSPKWSAILSNVKEIHYESGLLHLEFVSPYEEGFFKNEKQLISQLKSYFNKFELGIKEVETFVPKANIGYLKKEDIVETIKNTFQGEEI